ncbi:HNH endonuclease signature motif containing protein [Desulfofustis limnaeus]|uniref:HNH endonuclease signature motif containing protein n=1 Tax=Desulfofustis limnaeus TaxID=2740163 RepID=UPI00338FE6CF
MSKLNTLQKSRNSAFLKQAGRCFYCNFPMWLDHKDDFAKVHKLSSREADRFRCTAEHLLARSESGKDTKDNIVAACLYCNQNRHRRKNPPTPNRYKEFITRRIKKGKWIPSQLRSRISL